MADAAAGPHIILLMGVAGSGKSTVGVRLAADLRWPYLEADDFHPPGNIAKMARGEPLDDDDRLPWLIAIRRRMEEVRASGGRAVFSCSALKASYRDVLMGGMQRSVMLCHLSGPLALIQERVRSRSGHFMGPQMVASQFEVLEPPSDAVLLDITQGVEKIVAQVLAAASARGPSTEADRTSTAGPLEEAGRSSTAP